MLMVIFLFSSLVDESGNVTSKILLRNYYFIPEIVQRKDNYDHLSRGLLTQNAQDQDQYFTEEVYHIFICTILYQDYVMI